MHSNIMSSIALAVVCVIATKSTAAAPSGLAVPLAAPVVAPAAVVAPAPVVTAYSSQYVARNYNGIAVAPAVVPSAPLISYPYPYAPALPYAAAPLVRQYVF